MLLTHTDVPREYVHIKAQAIRKKTFAFFSEGSSEF